MNAQTQSSLRKVLIVAHMTYLILAIWYGEVNALSMTTFGKLLHNQSQRWLCEIFCEVGGVDAQFST